MLAFYVVEEVEDAEDEDARTQFIKRAMAHACGSIDRAVFHKAVGFCSVVFDRLQNKRCHWVEGEGRDAPIADFVFASVGPIFFYRDFVPNAHGSDEILV